MAPQTDRSDTAMDLAEDRASLCAAGAIDCTEDPTALPPANERVRFTWPLEARAITSGFGLRADPIEPEQTRFHRGLDLAASYGAMVRASAAGMVTDGRWAGGYGRHISINHGHGWVSTYSHLSLLLVSPGMYVEQGDPIGLVGESGRATGPHLHFEIMNPRGVVNPLRLLGTPPDSLAIR
jgi:murein DD-endopeptidase MepM/ murein hydrolase activator NlpD